MSTPLGWSRPVNCSVCAGEFLAYSPRTKICSPECKKEIARVRAATPRMKAWHLDYRRKNADRLKRKAEEWKSNNREKHLAWRRKWKLDKRMLDPVYAESERIRSVEYSRRVNAAYRALKELGVKI